jgi:3-oxoacyl-[acyl-carrier-protein] synthase-1
VSGFAAHRLFVDNGGKPLISACTDIMSEDVSLAGRLGSIARSALVEALAPMAQSARQSAPVHVFLGTREPGDLDKNARDALSLNVLNQAAELGINAQVRLIADGGAAGSMAIQSACALLQSGQADVALAGGADSFIDWNILEPLETAERIHSSVTKWGFCPGEAAAFCLLASGRVVREHGWLASGRILSAATTTEPHRIGTESVCLGEGLSGAMRQSLAAIHESHQRVARIISDMNGEPYRGDEFGFAMVRLSEYFTRGIEAETPADCWGNVGAATGPLAVILATEWDSRIEGDDVLSMSLTSSDNGHRTAMLVAAMSRS